jgi:hypothetical protein
MVKFKSWGLYTSEVIWWGHQSLLVNVDDGQGHFGGIGGRFNRFVQRERWRREWAARRVVTVAGKNDEFHFFFLFFKVKLLIE